MKTALTKNARIIQSGLVADTPYKTRVPGPVFERAGLRLLFRGRQHAWQWSIECDGETRILYFPVAPSEMGGVQVTFRLADEPVEQGTVRSTTKTRSTKQPSLMGDRDMVSAAFSGHIFSDIGSYIVARPRTLGTGSSLHSYLICVSGPGQSTEDLWPVLTKKARTIKKRSAIVYPSGTSWRVRFESPTGQNVDIEWDHFVEKFK